jgi:hypothetical protein
MALATEILSKKITRRHEFGGNDSGHVKKLFLFCLFNLLVHTLVVLSESSTFAKEIIITCENKGFFFLLPLACAQK